MDVFTSKRYFGNPVAVFFDADELSSDQMQAIARWTNLSETTFILRPTEKTADYKVRIFTPNHELPFAGHPTLGTCHAVIESGLINADNGRVVQECGAGLVEITVEQNKSEDTKLWFKLPYHKVSPIGDEALADVKRVLGVNAFVHEPILVDDGPKWLTLQLDDAEQVKKVEPDMAALALISKKYGWSGVGIFGWYQDGQLELRNLAPLYQVPEDPACGSGAGAVGTYLAHYSGPKLAIVLQGGCIGRNARLFVQIRNDSAPEFDVYVGGTALTCITGKYVAQK